MESNDYSQEITEDQKNRNKIRCQFCNCLILSRNSAEYIENEFVLPLIHQKRSQSMENMDTESFIEFWVVEDMFQFENVGFSNTVGNYKYLICADCERGPIGYHDLTTKKNYVALKRIKHEI